MVEVARKCGVGIVLLRLELGERRMEEGVQGKVGGCRVGRDEVGEGCQCSVEFLDAPYG